jgi:hypothetical protein
MSATTWADHTSFRPGLNYPHASSTQPAEPGKEDALLEIASAYEAASKRRVPPPAFGPLTANSRVTAP